MMSDFLNRFSLVGESRSRDTGSPQQQCLYLSGLAPGEELIPECEVIFEEEDDGLDSNYDWCEKNPKHKKFIPMCDFKKDNLPADWRKDSVMDFIHTRKNITVRIRIPYTSKDRPDFIWGQEKERNPYPYMHHKGNKNFTRNGTGCVIFISPEINEPCPCPLCKDDKVARKGYFLLTVRTVTHNVFNDEEAKLAMVDCFFNNDNDEKEGNIKTFYGLRVDDSDEKKDIMYKTDVCDVICVSHDKELVETLSKLLSKVKAMPDLPYCDSFTSLIISHPHGCTKRISVGKIPHLTIPVDPSYKINTPTPLPNGTTKCRVNTSSNTKEETNEISIPSGTTFTLPSNAGYAMRYHFGDQNRTSSFLTFPHGTQFTLQEAKTTDAQSTSIPNDAEFELCEEFFLPDHYFAGNIVGSCAGTSGAMVYSNLVEDEILTDMAHTSKLRSGKLGNLKTPVTLIPK